LTSVFLLINTIHCDTVLIPLFSLHVKKYKKTFPCIEERYQILHKPFTLIDQGCALASG